MDNHEQIILIGISAHPGSLRLRNAAHDHHKRTCCACCQRSHLHLIARAQANLHNHPHPKRVDRACRDHHPNRHTTYQFSINLFKEIEAAGGVAELYTYANDNHNISNSFTTAINRSIQFFDQYLKEQENDN